MSKLSQSRAALLRVLSEFKVSELTIPDEDARRMNELVLNNLKTFAISTSDVGRTHLATHKIEVENNPLFKERCRPVPHAWREFLDQELDKLLSFGAIVKADHGECPYASRCVNLQKKDNSCWLCVDYRRLNSITVKDSYLLPRINETCVPR